MASSVGSHHQRFETAANSASGGGVSVPEKTTWTIDRAKGLSRQYTYDVFPASAEHLPSRSKSIYSETTRPHSGATNHSSSTTNSSEDEEANPRAAPSHTCNYRNGACRKLSLTFLKCRDQSPPDYSQPSATHSDPSMTSSHSSLMRKSCHGACLFLSALGTSNRNLSEQICFVPSSSRRHALANNLFSKKRPCVLSRDQAANIIAREWRAWKARQDFILTNVVAIIGAARQIAVACIQRIWRGHQLRQFVYSEVCKLRILYWEPSLDTTPHEELKQWSVKVYGQFTVPSWSTKMSMTYCRFRRMFVLYTNVPVGTYQCKFVVNSLHKTCPWLHPTTLSSQGLENSAVVVAAHPRKEWWHSRLSYLERSSRRPKNLALP